MSSLVFGGKELVTDVDPENPTDPETPTNPGAINVTADVGTVTITDFGANDEE